MKKIVTFLHVFIITLLTLNWAAAQKFSLPDKIIEKDTTHIILTHLQMLNPIPFNNPFSKNSYYNCLGVMCQLEYKIQKAIKMPLCFRLGSVAYTNKVDAEPVNPNP